MLVLASAWLPWPKAPLAAGVVASLLNVAGYAASPASVAPFSFGMTNRVIAFAVIWTTALLLYRRLQLERALAASQGRYQALLAERVLQESQDRYRQLIEASPDAIIVHQDGAIRFVNPGALKLFGAGDFTALIGRSLLKFLPEAEPAESNSRADLLAAHGSGAWQHARLVRLDGRVLDVEVGAVGITIDGQAGVQTILRDISERKHAEKELARASGLVNQHLANTPLGVLEWRGRPDQLGQLLIRRWSGQAQAIFGFAEAEMIGKRWDELAVIAAPDVEKANASAQDLVAGVQPRNVVTLRCHTRDGRLRICRWYNSALLAENGGELTMLSLVEDITELVEAEERIRHLAHHDPLTGLPNRLLLQDRLEQALGRARRARNSVAVLLLDLDDFKTVNDTLGHLSGDELIRRVAQRLRALVRESDTVARLGGDEFAIVQTDLSAPAGAAVLARKAIAALRDPFDLEGRHATVGASIGIALFPQDGNGLEALLRHADIALYRAKAERRSRFAFFRSETKAEVLA